MNGNIDLAVWKWTGKLVPLSQGKLIEWKHTQNDPGTMSPNVPLSQGKLIEWKSMVAVLKWFAHP